MSYQSTATDDVGGIELHRPTPREITPNHNDESGEPTSCSSSGVITFLVGLVAGTFSAIICKVRLSYPLSFTVTNITTYFPFR